MAGIEKVCECSNDNCEYYGGEMYNFKLNSLQINPECRAKYHGLQAQIFIINPQDTSSDWYYAYSQWGGSYNRLYKKDDVYYDGILYNEERYKRLKNPYLRYCLTPIKKVFQLEVMVVVGNEVFYNTIWDIRKFKLNMIKMFGHGNISYKRLHKDYCKDYENTYDAFKNIEKKLLTEEKGNKPSHKLFDHIVSVINQ